MGIYLEWYLQIAFMVKHENQVQIFKSLELYLILYKFSHRIISLDHILPNAAASN